MSEIARWATFRDSYMVEFIKVIWLSWSSATLIDRFYNVPLLFFFWIVFLWILILKLLGKKYDKTFFVLYLIFISFIFIPLTPIYYTPLFPILREVWHIIPLIFLFLIFNLFWDIWKNKFFVSWFISLIIVFICYNSYHFFLNLPYVSYEWIRKETKQMHDFVKDQKTNHRFIIYPFFTQYALKNFQREFTLSWFPLNNSGFDMILKYSWKDYINDSVWWNILNSLQWHLIETKDLTNLKVRAVEYILDFSNIYDSNFKKFISPDVYDWKERNLMTNRLFVKNLPGLTYLEDKIYKINSLDRINWPIKSFERKNSTTYNISVKLDDRLRILSFLENFHFWWKIYLKNQHWLFSVPLFDKSHRIIYKYANSWDLDSKSIEDYVKQNFWEELKKEGFPKKLSNWELDYKYYIKNEDGSIDVELTLYFRPQSYFSNFDSNYRFYIKKKEKINFTFLHFYKLKLLLIFSKMKKLLIFILLFFVLILWIDFFMSSWFYYNLDTVFYPIDNLSNFFSRTVFFHFWDIWMLVNYKIFSKLFLILCLCLWAFLWYKLANYLINNFIIINNKNIILLLQISSIIFTISNPFIYERLVTQTWVVFWIFFI